MARLRYIGRHGLNIPKLKGRPMGVKLREGQEFDVSDNEKKDLLRSHPNDFKSCRKKEVTNDGN